MSGNHRTAVLTGFALFFGIGVVFGKIIYNFPYIEWDKEIDFISVLSWLTTIGIALAIPFLVKKGIDDNRGIKSFLVEEMKELIEIVKSIKGVITTAYENGEFKPSDRDVINNRFHSAEQKLASIQEQLRISFKDDSDAILGSIKSALSEYKQYLTGGEMMHSSFNKVSYNFNNENHSEHSKIETILKTSIHYIHKF